MMIPIPWGYMCDRIWTKFVLDEWTKSGRFFVLCHLSKDAIGYLEHEPI